MQKLTVQASIYAPIETVWKVWTDPTFIMQWNHAGDDRHCPAATNDLRVWGQFSYTMAAKDGSFQFDYSWEYTNVVEHQTIEFILWKMEEFNLDVGRTVSIRFQQEDDGTVKINETFDTEDINDVEMQKAGRQMILDNFKKVAEAEVGSGSW